MSKAPFAAVRSTRVILGCHMVQKSLFNSPCERASCPGWPLIPAKGFLTSPAPRPGWVG